jgi:hypothetical protein
MYVDLRNCLVSSPELGFFGQRRDPMPFPLHLFSMPLVCLKGTTSERLATTGNVPVPPVAVNEDAGPSLKSSEE